jgi:hypothetical protein
VLYVGLDDTDTLDTPGTNQLARALMARVAGRYACRWIVRHQLLEDPRVPCTSKNGSASISFMPLVTEPVERLIDDLRAGMRQWFVAGSDPGLCVALDVPEAVRTFGRRCQRELVDQQEARDLAAQYALHLEGLGGTEGGVIGALAAVGLAAEGNDGRVVHIGAWPDDVSGPQDLRVLAERGVEIRCLDSARSVTSGRIDVGKHLRPNMRDDQIVLFVQPAGADVDADWLAVKLP